MSAEVTFKAHYAAVKKRLAVDRRIAKMLAGRAALSKATQPQEPT